VPNFKFNLTSEMVEAKPRKMAVYWSCETIAAFQKDFGMDAEASICHSMAHLVRSTVRAYRVWFASLPCYCRLGLRVWWAARPMLESLRHALIR